MRNYGFDYLIEKVQVLNEMAQFSQFWRTNFPDFENFYIQVQDKMKEHPLAPVGTDLGHKRIEYISRMLFDFLSKKELADIGINKDKGFGKSYYNLAIRAIPPEERQERKTRKQTEYTPEYLKHVPKWGATSYRQQDFMLLLMVKAYEEKILSKKFFNKVMDDANIDAYFKKNLFKRGSSNFAFGTINKKEKMFGMSMEEAYIIQNKAKSIIQKLKGNKRLPKGISLSIYHADKNFEQQPEKENTNSPIVIFKNTLEELMEYRNRVVQYVDKGIKDGVLRGEEKGVELDTLEKIKYERNLLLKTHESIFTKVLEAINNKINANQDMESDKIGAFILKVMGNAGGLILNRYKRNFKLASIGDEFFQDEDTDATNPFKQDKYGSVYDTLNDDVLDELEEENIITSEENQLLGKWRKILSSLKQSIVSKSSRDEGNVAKAQNREDLAVLKDYEKQKADKEPKTKVGKNPKIDISSEVAGLSVDELIDKIREMYDNDDTDFEKVDAMEKYLKKLKKDNPEDEEGVMGYMTEQVNKDRHLNNVGEYKDRGFKKPINHAHWLWLNE